MAESNHHEETISDEELFDYLEAFRGLNITKRELARSIISENPDTTVRVLLSLLKSEDESKRFFALDSCTRILQRLSFTRQSLVEQVIELAELDSSIKIRRRAISFLGGLLQWQADTKLLYRYLPFIFDEDKVIQANAIEIIVRQNNVKTVPYLIQLLNDNNHQIVQVVADFLRRIHTPEAQFALQEWEARNKGNE